jgi:hypothetical protein
MGQLQPVPNAPRSVTESLRRRATRAPAASELRTAQRVKISDSERLARQADDANLSPRRIGAALRAGGHGVLALAEVANFEGLDDPLVFELAASQQRVFVTRNSGDFAPLAREWAEAYRQHAGLILIWTLDHSQFGEIIAGVERLIGQRSEQERWRDLVVAP